MNLLHLNDRPRAYPPSLYADQCGPQPDLLPLRGEARADVAVIGAGYTGLSAALHLARRGLSVRVLEAQRVGFGASGRNGGQIGSGQRQEVDWLEAQLGRDMARRLMEQKVTIRNLERQSAQRHLIRLREGQTESRETSSLHLDLLRDLKRINAHAVSVAHPILQDEGLLIESRLRGS